MKKFLSGLRGKTLLFILFTAALTQASCNRHFRGSTGGPIAHHASNWVNWNFIFKEGTDSAARRLAIEQIVKTVNSVRSDTAQRPAVYINDQAINRPLADQLSGYLQKVIRKGNSFSLDSAQAHFCSCHDTLLWNLTADLNIGGSGQSIPTAPPPPSPGAQGGTIAIVANNDSVSSPSLASPILVPGLVGFGGHPEVTKDIVLGIIDSGIDSTLFSPDIYSQLFASDGTGKVNFASGAPVSAYQDNDAVRHGSAVAAIALNAFYLRSVKDGRPQLPRLMVMRALDDNGMGSTLSVSCALSYAIRHHVSLINASLGYWNTQNAVIDHYLRQGARQGIPVVAAAGNDRREHIIPLCGLVDGHNKLRPGNLFYPACQSIDSSYCIISVTGLSNPYEPCRYQNYSSRYVSVGVVNDSARQFNSAPNICCGFTLPFINSARALDGSSFATPVISGELAYKILKNGGRTGTGAYMQLLQAKRIPKDFLTWDGQYITY